MPHIFNVLLFFLSNCLLISAQSPLEKQELELNATLLTFRKAITAEQMDDGNKTFKNKMSTFLQQEGAFNYKFKFRSLLAELKQRMRS